MSYTVNVPQASIGQSTTCLTCGIRLPSLETQQLHHKSDWHTYNLKRKMVYLPPVASEVFAQLVTASREQANPAEVAQPECVPCGKKYLSFQAYDNHVNSKKHKQIAAAYEKKQQSQASASAETSSSTAIVETGTTGAAPKDPVEQLAPSDTVCLFCSHSASDASSNYEHMRTAHGFFLPSTERLIDLSGMLTYLAEKLVHDHDCLWCTPSVFSQNLNPDQELHSGFATLASVRRHMLDKGHCKLAMDQGAEREYADFYLPNNDLLASDQDEDDATDDSSMVTDTMLDDDERRLNAVLLDEDGNWILDNDSTASSSNTAAGIRIDPTTNELVLNHRRLSHKDAARRQKVESRTVTLTSRSQRRPSSSTEGSPEDEAAAAAAQEEEEGISASSDTHHPHVRLSSALLKSQNQLSGSTLAVGSQQLQHVSGKVAKAQDFESFKREKMSTRLSLNANHTARARCAPGFGTKV
ncbi:hypothetical protein BGZ70_000717 [Mortierella alpina]|uniref:C2H2-type domain-containing protein n=1 Tax=Mortierella alpina TaxID=64518 RepID=A0A9P6IXN5_MORAP|nr:hypothetical protein BGZ70_000717 [Mortierella alpina]